MTFQHSLDDRLDVELGHALAKLPVHDVSAPTRLVRS
jgi:hypothetical protein